MRLQSSAPLGRNVPDPCRVRGDVLKAVFQMHSLRRSRMLFDRYTRPPFARWPDRPRNKAAATVRAHIVEFVFDANRIELFDDVGFHARAEVFTALHEKRLIDQVAESVLLLVVDGGLQLFGSATILAILGGFFDGGGF